jgi:ATP-dependent 26S proteasome regulatory subunit
MTQKLDTMEQVRRAFAARFPCVWMEGIEERRALSELAELVDGTHKLYVWSLTGTRRRLTKSESVAQKGALYEQVQPQSTPEEAIEFVTACALDKGQSMVMVFCELDELIAEDVVLRRRFREMIEDVKSRPGRHAVVLTPRAGNVPKSLDKTVTVVRMSVPSYQEHMASVQQVIKHYRDVSKKDKPLVDLSEPQVERLVSAATGLTKSGLDRALAVALTEYKVLDERVIGLVAKQKKELVDGTGFLQYEEPAESLSDVGGQDLLKKWLMQRMKAFGPKAREYGLTEPKGVLTVGPPGTGKSLGAKAASVAWGRPLLRLDVGALFGGLVGESERNMREAIDLIEAMSPCVLWIDEIEKGLSGMSSSGNTDGGTTARVFQSLLTWLNEKKSAVFVYATANDPTKLPPELLRKGRLDEIFAIMLPTHVERQEVLSIHIAKRKRDPAQYDLAKLASAADGFSGAELEQAVVDAMFHAFDDGGRQFTTDDVLFAISATQPMSRTMRERINEMAAWAKSRARPASSSSDAPPKQKQKQIAGAEDPVGLDCLSD